MKIVLSVALVLLLVGCSEESKQEVQKSEAKQVVQQTASVVKVAVKEPAPVTPIAVAAPDAKAIFKVCASCHGQKGEKVALGKSKVIKGWNPQEVKIALKGYKDGSYGGPMKSVMKGQADKLDDEQISALGEYISKL